LPYLDSFPIRTQDSPHSLAPIGPAHDSGARRDAWAGLPGVVRGLSRPMQKRDVWCVAAADRGVDGA
jgi:hypothetical protein